MARAAGQHKTKSAKRTSRRKTRPDAFDVLLEDVFPLEPHEALQRLTALARQWPSMPVLRWGVRSKRWEILPLEAISVSVEIDPATGADTLGIRDTRYFHPALDEPAEFYARSTDTKDIERAELLDESSNNLTSDYDPVAAFEREWKEQPRTPPRLAPIIAASAPIPSKEPQHTLHIWSPRPPASQTAAVQQPEDKVGPAEAAAAPAVSEVATQDVSREAQCADPPNTSVDGRPTAINSSTAASPPAPATKGRGSRQQRTIQQIAGEEFPDGCDQIETGVIIHRVADRLGRQKLPVPKRDVFLRALGRRKD